MNAIPHTLDHQESRSSLSIPKRGHVLTSIAETYGGPIRCAVAMIAAGLEAPRCKVPTKIIQEAAAIFGEADGTRSPAETVAWHVCTQWVVATALGTLSPGSTLIEAVQWFTGKEVNPLAVVAVGIASRTRAAAIDALSSVADPAALADLLPYVLDPHGEGSRLSIRRDPTTRATRDAKRAAGVYYTPQDVADYMTRLAFSNLSPCHPVTVFDPACGTGVYLRAALAALMVSHPTADPLTLAEQSLFGVDIDPWAVDASAYVLLHDVSVNRHGSKISPESIWRLLRLNLCVADALRLDPASHGSSHHKAKQEDRAKRLAIRAGKNVAGANVVPQTRQPINCVFPTLGLGPRVVLGNPPYAAIGLRRDIATLAALFDTLRPVASTVDIHTLFLEQMVRLAAADSSCALVLPLSIAFNTRPQYRAARSLIERTHGVWRFSFFDREPHALFGEDVKTRNAILAWSRTGDDQCARIMTGPLHKWRGDSRARMLASITFTAVERPIADGIPKLAGALQSEALRRMDNHQISHMPPSYEIGRMELTNCFSADRNLLFVASTAYNFLNAFLKPPGHSRPGGNLSSNEVFAIKCRSHSDTLALYALLSSRTAFWLWHTLGDGFHVTRKFLEEMPLSLGTFDMTERKRLADLGAKLWSEVQRTPIVSCNRGSYSLAFPASQSLDIQREIDDVIIKATALPAAFAAELKSFVQSVVNAEPCGLANAPNSEESYL